MYIPPPMKMDNQQQAFDLIEQFSFGVIVSNIEGLEASHLPFMLDRGHGDKGRLLCHFAKANPQWKDLAEREVLVVFSGPTVIYHRAGMHITQQYQPGTTALCM